jgi:hypothetical protein
VTPEDLDAIQAESAAILAGIERSAHTRAASAALADRLRAALADPDPNSWARPDGYGGVWISGAAAERFLALLEAAP